MKCACNFIDLTGQKFGRLTVVDRMVNDKRGEARWKCLCVCGKNNIVRGGDLRDGHIKSCGCLNKEIHTTHGMWGSATYKIWDGMLGRCNNPKNFSYLYYGGRGIKVCDRWLEFKNFFKDMGERPKELTLERINNNKGYFKENCCWASRTIQSRNQRIRKTNKTGTAGVYWRKDTQKYCVQIVVSYKTITIGCFTNLQNAIEARKQAEKEYWERT